MLADLEYHPKVSVLYPPDDQMVEKAEHLAWDSPLCVCAALQNTTKNGAHYRGCKPLVTPFATTFSGSLPPPIQELTFPEIPSPPIKEKITDPPIVHTVLNLGNGPCLVAYPLGTPDWEKVMV
ncbi:hypothetical protein DSO57_1004260 [Entomophthora muscae]|uniref:Uncharacterized protein n=1 Tax=Entomophthora muscae TaxID=34485 RepID=A0ACC2RZ62_9FUNG|nr:hypothetical protein DSO57_1004260 [Entomophthora muscae]